jgi:hypothetical protein
LEIEKTKPKIISSDLKVDKTIVAYSFLLFPTFLVTKLLMEENHSLRRKLGFTLLNKLPCPNFV